MDDDIFPKHYDAWKVCITKKCKIPLTRDFIEERIRDLSDETSASYKTFVQKYGPHWTQTVRSYFKQALSDPDID